MQSNYYDTHELDNLNQKINNKFIRPSMHNKPERYNIPASSELIASKRPFILQTMPPKPMQMQIPTYRPPPSTRIAVPTAAPPAVLNCILVNEHATTCSVCSKLYKTYHAIYLSIIAILVIVILFLLKKIFMVKSFKGT
jgi:hypothetical protein